MFPADIFFSDSLNSFSCSSVSSFVSLYSSSSRSSLCLGAECVRVTKILEGGPAYFASSRSDSCATRRSSCSSRFCFSFAVSCFPPVAILMLKRASQIRTNAADKCSRLSSRFKSRNNKGGQKNNEECENVHEKNRVLYGAKFHFGELEGFTFPMIPPYSCSTRSVIISV